MLNKGRRAMYDRAKAVEVEAEAEAEASCLQAITCVTAARLRHRPLSVTATAFAAARFLCVPRSCRPCGLWVTVLRSPFCGPPIIYQRP